jgi:hypothetical protein
MPKIVPKKLRTRVLSKEERAEMLAAMKADAGKGFENFLANDRHYWLAELPEYDENIDSDWILAIDAIYGRQDKKPLLDLLVSDRKLSGLARYFLADLVDRTRFGEARKPTPIYDPPFGVFQSMLNVQRVKALRAASRRRGVRLSVDKAISLLAKDNPRAIERIAADYQRKHDWIKEFKQRVAKRHLRRFGRKPEKR